MKTPTLRCIKLPARSQWLCAALADLVVRVVCVVRRLCPQRTSPACEFNEGFATRLLYLIVILAVGAPAAMSAPVPLQNATATFTQLGFHVSQTIDGNLGGASAVNGWAIADSSGFGSPQTAVYETQTDVSGPGGVALTFTLTQNFGISLTIGRFRLSVTQYDRTNFADGIDNGGDVTANWVVLTPVSALATNGATLTMQPDLSILASGVNPDTSVYTVAASTTVTNITGIRLEAIQDASLPSNGPGRYAAGNFVLQEFTVDAAQLAAPNADFDESGQVTGADLIKWKAGLGTTAGANHMQGDADSDADVDGYDFLAWQRQLGGAAAFASSSAVPEPATLLLAIVATAGIRRMGGRMRQELINV